MRSIKESCLNRLILCGEGSLRRAVREFVAQVRSLPEAGAFAVIVDGSKTPRCIVRTAHVETKRMRDVDAQFAWDTGGGDRSLEWFELAWVSSKKINTFP